VITKWLWCKCVWFITQVNEKLVAKNPYYNSGDLIGRQGVEESYEDLYAELKGQIHSKDKFNREIGSYKKYDTIAVQGEDINLTRCRTPKIR
jgi:penicillin-binding protein 2